MPQKTTPNKNFYFAISADIFSSSIGRHPENPKLNVLLKNNQILWKHPSLTYRTLLPENKAPQDEGFSSWGKKKSLRSKPEAHRYIKLIPRNRKSLVALAVTSAVASTSHNQQNNLLQANSDADCCFICLDGDY